MSTRAREGISASANQASQTTVPVRTNRAAAAPRIVSARSGALSLYRFPLFVGAVHLLIVQLAASLAYHFGRSTGGSGPQNYQANSLSGLADVIVGPMRNWDGLWYTMIAEQGYGRWESPDGLATPWTAKAAFWPLFPWAMRIVSDVTGLAPEVAGYLIANICFIFALLFLYRLVALDFDERIARRTLWALALFPTSLFFSAVYTESPFLMLSVGCLLAARLRMWWLAGILGASAALTRSYGVFLGLPLALLFVQQYGFYIRSFFPRGIAVAMPALGPAIFSWHLDRVQGSYKAFIDVQNQWYRTSAMPWETMRCAIEGCVLNLTVYGDKKVLQVDGADWGWLRAIFSSEHWSLFKDFKWRTLSSQIWDLAASESWRKGVADGDTLELVSTLLLIGIAVIGLWKLPLYHSVYLIPSIVIPLLQPSAVHPLMSMPRFALTMFPAFIVLALILRPRAIAITAAAVSTLLLVFFTIQFANWYWVS